MLIYTLDTNGIEKKNIHVYSGGEGIERQMKRLFLGEQSLHDVAVSSGDCFQSHHDQLIRISH